MPAPKPGAKKESTNDVPMHDLEEIIRFVTTIHEKGLETAAMPQIAIGCGYKHATSTPFYRRMVASRLFGLLSKSGAELTVRASDYLRPDSQGADRKALYECILSIKPYAEIVERFRGKKLNVDLVANGLAKSLNITDACAMICAKSFEASLKFAGLLGSDLAVNAEGIISAKANSTDEQREPEDEETPLEDVKTQSHKIYLDKTKQRKFEVIAPIDITAAELKRAKGFLDFALIVDQSIPSTNEEESTT